MPRWLFGARSVELLVNSLRTFLLINVRLCLLVTVLLCCVSCSPSRKLARLHDRHPELFPAQTIDSISVRVDHYDTFIDVRSFADTFILFDSITKTVERTIFKRDTVRILMKAAPCTTFVRKVITSPQIVVKQKKKSGWQNLNVTISLLALILFLWTILTSRKSK